MLKIFYGDDRKKALDAVERLLGKDYEVVEADNLTTSDMASVFLGTSIFGEKRKILLKALSENKDCWEKLPNFIDTPHDIVILEASLDKRTTTYKELAKNKSLEVKEFLLVDPMDAKAARSRNFEVFKLAFRGQGAKAVALCDELAKQNDPYMMLGLLTAQAMRELERGSGARLSKTQQKAVAALKILAEADIAMKSTAIEAWNLVKMALLRIGQL
ncbi:hypothetical protein IKF15_02455 [Candidatus Saccharibacteria bacterium]|nr:hypothetical protein [Candidatus Saccharibacteria bacterium]